MTYEVAALGAALCWTFAALLAGNLSRQLGGITFNRLRIVGVFFVLLVFVSLAGLWESLKSADLGIIFLSGFIGIAIGDSFLFSAMKRLGPRRAQILYACNAPISVILGILFLGERLDLFGIIGIILVFSGIIAAIAWSRPKSAENKTHAWETTEGSVLVAVVFGLIAALGQSVGSIIIKPVLVNGADPMMVTTLRVGISALLLTTVFHLRKSAVTSIITSKQRLLSTLNGVIAIGVGFSLLLYAFSIGDVGTASILSSTQAVMILPIIWLKTRQRPALRAWVGAVLVTAGIGVMMR